jgi:SAM-dependent methyltransferase
VNAAQFLIDTSALARFMRRDAEQYGWDQAAAAGLIATCPITGLCGRRREERIRRRGESASGLSRRGPQAVAEAGMDDQAHGLRQEGLPCVPHARPERAHALRASALTWPFPQLGSIVPLSRKGDSMDPKVPMDQTNRHIRTVEDVLTLLDGLFTPDADRWTKGGADWWDDFYADRSKPVPFFVAKPDESLVSYVDRKLITPGGRALDLGCGPGRNALRLAALGWEVDAIDLSPTAIAWAEERAREAGVDANVRFHCGDAFAPTGVAAELTSRPYDLIYDSGCFHHLPPHRRVSYLALLDRALAPGGRFALSCFAAGGMGSELPDAAFYLQSGGLQGGLAYTPESLRWIFSELTEVELRRMHDEPPESPYFGEPFLWTALFRRGSGGDRHPPTDAR